MFDNGAGARWRTFTDRKTSESIHFISFPRTQRCLALSQNYVSDLLQRHRQSGVHFRSRRCRRWRHFALASTRRKTFQTRECRESHRHTISLQLIHTHTCSVFSVLLTIMPFADMFSERRRRRLSRQPPKQSDMLVLGFMRLCVRCNASQCDLSSPIRQCFFLPGRKNIRSYNVLDTIALISVETIDTFSTHYECVSVCETSHARQTHVAAKYVAFVGEEMAEQLEGSRRTMGGKTVVRLSVWILIHIHLLSPTIASHRSRTRIMCCCSLH